MCCSQKEMSALASQWCSRRRLPSAFEFLSPQVHSAKENRCMKNQINWTRCVNAKVTTHQTSHGLIQNTTIIQRSKCWRVPAFARTCMKREREREDVCARVEKERVFRDLHQGGDGAAPCRGSRQDEWWMRTGCVTSMIGRICFSLQLESYAFHIHSRESRSYAKCVCLNSNENQIKFHCNSCINVLHSNEIFFSYACVCAYACVRK